jgi:hypothetical protein
LGRAGGHVFGFGSLDSPAQELNDKTSGHLAIGSSGDLKMRIWRPGDRVIG